MINTLEYDLSYLLNLIEMKMTLKKGEKLSPTDLANIRRIKDRIADKKEDIKRGVEILREFDRFEQNFRFEINEKIAELEARINEISPKVAEKTRLLKSELNVFQYNDKSNEFQEKDKDDDLPLHGLFDSDSILLFVDRRHKRVWMWIGNNTTTRMKFIAAKLAPSIRDRYGIGFKISTVDEGNEKLGFKVALGIEEEPEYFETQPKVVYEDTDMDLELLDSISREKILLLLEKTNVPEGYERKMVVVNNNLYEYKEIDRNYLGSIIKEKKLNPLKEKVEDGPYLAENYVPRMLFSSNKIVLIDILQKVGD